MHDLHDRGGKGNERAAEPALSNQTDIFLKPDSMIVASAVMEAIPAMVAVLDSDLNYVYANQRYVDIVNSSRPSWRGLKLFEYLPEYLHEQIKPRVARAAKGEAVSYYLDFVPRDGITRTILVNYHQLMSDANAGLFVMSGLDATDLRLAERRLAEAQKFETIGQLTGGIAHDFNNNIAAILGIFSLLKNVVSDGQLQGWIQTGIGAAEQCSKLTSQLLTFARRQTIQPSALNVESHINSVISLLLISMPDKISISFDNKTPDLAVYADPTQFESAIINLIFNARDALPNGGRIRIETALAKREGAAWFKVAATKCDKAAETADFVLVEVSDDGVGMTEEIANLAFEPFFTTKKRGGGSGMGLAMVDGFARQSAGAVELNTAEGLGTSVRLYLPRAERAEAYRKEAVITQPVTSVKLSVLVVEDEDDVAFVFQEMLRSMGHISITCKTAREALAIMESTDEIGVVLTDIMIGGAMSGLELRERILEQYPKVRVICTSGYQSFKSDSSIKLSSDIEFLPKPFSFDDLARQLDSGGARRRVKDAQAGKARATGASPQSD